MPATSEFHVDERGVEELFQSPSGDVRKHMNDVGRQVVVLAKRYVGKRTHALEHSINYRLLNTPGGVLLEVNASNHVALMHHQGTRPHVILPRHGRMLRFKQGGRVVYARQVLHPGTRPNPFLVTALREVVR